MAGRRQVINRLAERSMIAGASPNCIFGREERRRGGACSACIRPTELEIDRAVTQLIKSSSFRRVGVCPYRVVASHLVAGLTLGPEALRIRHPHNQDLVDPVTEVKGALKRLSKIVFATGLSREDIETISNDADRWQPLRAVVTAERALKRALQLFEPQTPAKASRPARGRTGDLHVQAVARAMAGAWHQLTGGLPAKDNSKFHNLLLAAITTIYGHPDKEPNLESATKIAVERIREDMRTGAN